MADALNLDGFRALIMGATGMIPGSVALRLAAAGADVALTTATPDAEEALELRRLARSVSDLGRRCLVESVDMSIGANVQITVRQVVKALGRIDLLVTAPDYRDDRASERLSDAEWSKVLGLNLGGVFFACRGAAREMQGQEPPAATPGRRGRIIITTADQEAGGGGAAYRAAKAGVAGLARALHQEWAPKGIGVSLLVLPTVEDEAVVAKAGVLIAELAVAPVDVSQDVVVRVEA